MKDISHFLLKKLSDISFDHLVYIASEMESDSMVCPQARFERGRALGAGGGPEGEEVQYHCLGVILDREAVFTKYEA